MNRGPEPRVEEVVVASEPDGDNMYLALYDYNARSTSEMSFLKGDKLLVRRCPLSSIRHRLFLMTPFLVSPLTFPNLTPTLVFSCCQR